MVQLSFFVDRRDLQSTVEKLLAKKDTTKESSVINRKL